MEILNYIIFLMICLGVTDIICREYVLSWLRNFIDKYFHFSILNKLIQCPTCVGFWVGVALTFIFPYFGIHWFIGGVISSITNKIIGIHVL